MRAAYGRTALAWTTLALTILCTGCATARDPRDPLEPVNRKVFQFNDAVDKAITKPVAQGYRAVVPPPVRGGITNFFGNFRDVTTAVNNLLQLKVPRAASDLGRILINSTVGILGFFDVASRLGLEKHDEDFGQTLGHYGVEAGPFLMLPLLGPSTARDTVGLVGDYFTDPEFYIFNHTPESYIVFGTRIINLRANLLAIEGLLDQSGLDQYAFLRDAYLQRRRNQIYDGNPPDAQSEPGAPRRKTLKEMEEELDLDQPEAAPVQAPPVPDAAPPVPDAAPETQ
jgi:phospholipid-binding lipoprotein MlaA